MPFWWITRVASVQTAQPFIAFQEPVGSFVLKIRPFIGPIMAEIAILRRTQWRSRRQPSKPNPKNWVFDPAIAILYRVR
jgi:hypothetical protein